MLSIAVPSACWYLWWPQEPRPCCLGSTLRKPRASHVFRVERRHAARTNYIVRLSCDSDNCNVRRRQGALLPAAAAAAAALGGSAVHVSRAEEQSQALVGGKKLLVFRHGEGHHQTDKIISNADLGAQLTDRGIGQAMQLRANVEIGAMLASSKQPLFVASNLIRAVETMAYALPGRPMVIQPLAREVCFDESVVNRPSQLDALELWLQERGLNASLEPYKSERTKFKTFDEYFRDLVKEDRQLPFPRMPFLRPLGNMQALSRAQRLITWISHTNADTVFLASHGRFMAMLDAEADDGVFASVLSFVRGEKTSKNCQVRTYRLWAASGMRDMERNAQLVRA
eukprot:TRINITY_DN88571_c0_g1_i1.p1 TRINITY_DN88571_c0_g1~~TRINITY_DN88571_c0_g1_i1.p1  ORF type:complete len:341 (-),score=39.17 TRINITY_DN88571_c0_g1_i1:46-1068(-)